MPPPANQFIARLARPARAALVDACSTIALAAGEVLCKRGVRYSGVLFPMTGVLSVVAPGQGQSRLGVALVGAEGMLGSTIALGMDRAPTFAFVLLDGQALRLSTAGFLRALDAVPGLRALVQRQLFDETVALMVGGACAKLHCTEQRLARCLMMLDERVRAAPVQLTDAHLAALLGVRRSSVTIASGALRDSGLIRYSRGTITILDRRGLAQASCGC